MDAEKFIHRSKEADCKAVSNYRINAYKERHAMLSRKII